MINSLFSKIWLQFLLFLIVGGLISMMLKFEVTWDLANYHYYNAWMLLEGRFNYDLLVAGFNGFFNPVADIPLYYLITYFNDYPNFICFMQGLWFGVLGFVWFKIIKLFFVNQWAVFFCLLFGLCGYGVFFQIGTCSNEIMVNCFLLLSLYMLLKVFFGKTDGGLVYFFLAGLMAGSAMGLKLTAVIYCAALGISLILFYKKIPQPFKSVFFFALGGLVGVLLFNGYWFWLCWTHFRNPLFPFANDIFNSEFWHGGNYFDKIYIPKNLKEFLLLPFDIHRGEGQSGIYDFRLALMYFVILFLAVRYFFMGKKDIFRNVPLNFICVFIFISYLVWIAYFGIARYMLPIEILSALLLVKAAIYFEPTDADKKVFYRLFLFACGLALLLNPLCSVVVGCRNCSLSGGNFSKFVAADDICLPNNTLVLFYRHPHGYPAAGLLPYWAQKTKNLRGMEATPINYQRGYFSNEVWRKQRDEILKNHTGPKVAVLAVKNAQNVDELKNENVELKEMKCRQLRTNLVTPHYIYFLCAPTELFSQIWE